MVRKGLDAVDIGVNDITSIKPEPLLFYLGKTCSKEVLFDQSKE